jgi:branched-chain amino acid transport system ATP-binding protein
MLEVRDLVVGYGKIEAVHGVSFGVGEGEVVGILGANGAGKSTILKAISGLVKPTAGTITLGGKNLLATPVHDIPRLGVAHVPEGRGLFPSLSIMDNLMLGRYVHGRRGHSGELDMVLEMFPWFKDRSHQRAGSLSGGQQQQLAIARALMLKPSLLILDEPSLGLAPIVVAEVFAKLAEIRDTSILLVEQNAEQALGLVQQAIVLENGRITMSGTRDELRASDYVAEAYFGDENYLEVGQ